MNTWALWFAVPPLLPLAMTLVNLATWAGKRSSGRAEARSSKRVSVLIPARNEEDNIEACVRAVLESEHPIHEVIVCDDQSTDRTAEILASLPVDVIVGEGVPPGWIGKPHACHHLARHATGDLLVFVDADTRLTPEAIGRIVSRVMDHDVGVVTAVPHQQMVSWAERLILPLLLLTYTSWFPLVLVRKSRDPRFTAANGQLLAVQRRAYQRIGGFASVRAEIVDDVAFCRHAKSLGERVDFIDGRALARCRMYQGFGELWRGFEKNIYEGIGGTPFALAVTCCLYAGVFVAPYVAVLVGLLALPEILLPALWGVAANVALRLALVISHRHPLSGVVWHPFSVLLLLALAVSSFRASRRQSLSWAGRTYAARDQRLETTT